MSLNIITICFYAHLRFIAVQFLQLLLYFAFNKIIVIWDSTCLFHSSVDLRFQGEVEKQNTSCRLGLEIHITGQTASDVKWLCGLSLKIKITRLLRNAVSTFLLRKLEISQILYIFKLQNIVGSKVLRAAPSIKHGAC